MGDNEVRQAEQGKAVKDIASKAKAKKPESKGLMAKAKEKIAEVKGTDKTKEKTDKILVEREYMVPLRKEWLKVPKYKRANKATKALKQFIAQHMKVYDRDLREVKVEVLLNNEIRFRGMKNG